MNFPIKAFCLRGNTKDEKIEVVIEELFGFPHEMSYDGGYDFRGTLNIRAGSFAVNNATIEGSTGALSRFFSSLKQCYQSLDGTAEVYRSLDEEFVFSLKMTKLGHAVIEGKFLDPHSSNKLIFEIKTDQTYMFATINELRDIENLFGN